LELKEVTLVSASDFMSAASQLQVKFFLEYLQKSGPSLREVVVLLISSPVNRTELLPLVPQDCGAFRLMQ